MFELGLGLGWSIGDDELARILCIILYNLQLLYRIVFASPFAKLSNLMLLYIL